VICSLQLNRHTQFALFTHRTQDSGGKYSDRLEIVPGTELYPIATGHFGLTLIRTSALARMKHPWFIGQPAEDGTWTPNKCVDDDITFWQQFERLGMKAFVALHVVIGHLEEFIMWPGPDLKCVYQRAQDYFESGKPEGLFQ